MTKFYDGRERWSATPRRTVRRDYSVAELEQLFSGPPVLTADELERRVMVRLEAMSRGWPRASFSPGERRRVVDAAGLERVVMARLEARPDVKAMLARIESRGGW